MDPSTRRQMLDTMHKATAHVTIPFGPRAVPLTNNGSDSSRNKKTDSASIRKTDTSRNSGRTVVRKASDSAALKPKDKPVVQKDTSTNQAP